MEDVSAVCVSVGGTLRWVCLTYPDPTLLSKPAAKRDKTAGLGRLLPSTVLSPYKKTFPNQVSDETIYGTDCPLTFLQGKGY